MNDSPRSRSGEAKEAKAEHVLIRGEDEGTEFAMIVGHDGKPAIRISVSGNVIVMPALKWYEAARRAALSESGDRQFGQMLNRLQRRALALHENWSDADARALVIEIASGNLK